MFADNSCFMKYWYETNGKSLKLCVDWAISEYDELVIVTYHINSGSYPGVITPKDAPIKVRFSDERRRTSNDVKVA